MKKVLSILLVALMLSFIITLVACNDSEPTTTATYCKHDNPEKIIVVEETSPTCQNTGLTEGLKCLNCDTMVVPQVIVKTIECIESNYWIIDKDADFGITGNKHTECTMCGKLFSNRTIPALSQGLEYQFNPDFQSYAVMGIGTCTDTDIVIPSMYEGVPVTRIGDDAFMDCDSITSIIFEENSQLISIGYSAFFNCYSLTSIEIPDTVTSIGEYAFALCASLTSIIFGENSQLISIEYGAFDNCNSLTRVNIPDSVTSIGVYAFFNCYSLTRVNIPDSVTSIGIHAFYGCDSLTIYCEAFLQPSGWDSNWNYSNCPVVWGYTGK